MPNCAVEQTVIVPRGGLHDTVIIHASIIGPSRMRTSPMMRIHRPAVALASSLVLLAVLAGCDEDKPAAKPKVQARDTLNKTTQVVLELKPELAKGGVVTDGKIHSTEYLDQQADAYRTSVGNIAKMRVQHDMDIYEVLNGEKPKTYEEFMEQIIKKGRADGIQLPMLPYYQEYGYDAENKALVVIEYPAKKKAMKDQTARDGGKF